MTKKKSRRIAEGSDWTLESIARYDEEIGRVARQCSHQEHKHAAQTSHRLSSHGRNDHPIASVALSSQVLPAWQVCVSA